MAKQFDVVGFLQSNGVQVKGRNSDGSFKIVKPDGQDGSFDAQGFLQSNQMTDVVPTLGAADKPFDDNPLGFFDRVQYAAASTPAEKAKFLKNQGLEVVGGDPSKGFTVKRGDDYLKVDDSFLASMTAEAGVIAGGIAGAKGGAAIGTAIAPGIGTAAGAILGAGLGAAIGKGAQIERAEKLGIRDDVTADQMAVEMGKEALFSMAGESVPLVGRFGAAGIKAFGNATKKLIGKGISDDAAVIALKYAGEKGGVAVDDMVEFAAAPERVGKIAAQVDEWAAKNIMANADTFSIANPADSAMAKNFVGLVSKARKKMTTDFGKVLDEVAPEIQGAVTNGEDFSRPLLNTMKDAGLLDADYKWLGDKALANATDSSKFKTLYKTLAANNLIPTPGKSIIATPKDMQNVISTIDGIIEKSNMFGAGGEAMSSQAGRFFAGMRSAADEVYLKTIEMKSPKAAQMVAAQRETYSARRELFDALADGTAPDKLQGFLNKFTDAKRSAEMQTRFVDLANSVGESGKGMLKEMLQLRAGRNVSKMFRKTAGNAVQAGAMSVIPGADPVRMGAKITSLINDAKTVQVLQSLSADGRKALMKNPGSLDALFQAGAQATQLQLDMEQELLNGVGQR